MNCFFIILSFCLTIFSSAGLMADDTRDVFQKMAGRAKMKKMREALRKEDRAISFYGKVMDQNGNPVSGARVFCHIHHFSPKAEDLFGAIKACEYETDGQGRFAIENEIGRSLYFTKISKDGYDDMKLLSTQRNFEYFTKGVEKPFVAEKDAPIEFRLRKRGMTTFCLTNNNLSLLISADKSGTSRGYDFVREKLIKNLEAPFLNGEPLISDLIMKATLNQDDGTWKVTLLPGTPNGGIIASELLLYEAPNAGYQPEYSFTPEDRKPLKIKYIYVKSRDPAIYTRIELQDYFNANLRYFCLSTKITVTNPYGDRSLEYLPDLPWEIYVKLDSEARMSLNKGELPKSPDIKALLEDFRNTKK